MIQNLPFGTPQYKRYKNSFLQQIMVVLLFDLIPESEKAVEAWRRFTQSTFGTPSEKNFFQQPIQLAKSDKSQSFVFANGVAAVKIKAQAYSNFADTIVPQVFKLRRFIEEIGGKDALVKGIRICKANVWRIESHSGLESISHEVRRQIFSDAYNDYSDNAVTPIAAENRMEDIKKTGWKEGDKIFTMTSGWTKFLDKDNVYSLILNTDFDNNLPDGVKLEKVEGLLGEMNYTLFCAFDWAVNDYVKRIMDMED